MPTFDEWHTQKYGCSFESKWERPGMMLQDSLKALSKELRNYVSELARPHFC